MMSSRQSPCLGTVAATVAVAFFCVASIFLGPDGAIAAEPASNGPDSRIEPRTPNPWSSPRYPDAKATLDQNDEIATLEALQITLSEMGDGTTYVWHRGHGRLSGAFQATSSFKDASGRICRHVVMILSSGTYNRKAEGIACRLDNGVWQLEG